MLDIRQQVDLKPFNSFAVHANAAYFATAHDLDDIKQALEFISNNDLPLLVLGGGSNILFVNDFPGLVLRIAIKGIDWLEQGLLQAGAGENWHDLVMNSLDKEMFGLENLALIPGTVGAAPIQNIGAYGVEVEQFVVSVAALDLESQNVLSLDREACEFAYRDSLFKSGCPGRYVLLSVTLQLATEWSPRIDYPALRHALERQGLDTPAARQVFETVCSIRSSKLPDPLQIGNAGSFFKNPLVSRSRLEQLLTRYPGMPNYPTDDADLVKIPAAWMLDHLGWKGRKRGNAAVHEDHALVIVNPGKADGEEIFLLAQDMSNSVLTEFGIALQPEVRII